MLVAKESLKAAAGTFSEMIWDSRQQSSVDVIN